MQKATCSSVPHLFFLHNYTPAGCILYTPPTLRHLITSHLHCLLCCTCLLCRPASHSQLGQFAGLTLCIIQQPA
jgi:hypothetical protein